MQRKLDLLLSFFGLILLIPVLLLLFILGWWNFGSPIFIQKRVGRNQKVFLLYKFRSMSPGTHSVPTHMIDAKSIGRYGAILRKTKLDELPQLINVVKGEMSLVGYRPCLPTQEQLIEARVKNKVFNFRPGITGLAQINNIDMSQPALLAEIDKKMYDKMDLKMYFYYILKTIFKR